MKSSQPSPLAPPCENLYRALDPGVFELRAAAGDGEAMPTMVGHFATFNTWTEIDSIFEGTFLERIAPGAFAKTIAENRASIRVLLEHGRDPQVGNKPLGAIDVLREDAMGAYYEVPLLETSYNRDLVPALDSGQYGSSFRFRVVKEEFNKTPSTSTHNPKGLPERTIKECQVMEFGPCVFPAYSSATAGLRSLTDQFVLGRLLDAPERLPDLIEAARAAASRTRAGLTHEEFMERIAVSPRPPAKPKIRSEFLLDILCAPRHEQLSAAEFRRRLRGQDDK